MSFTNDFLSYSDLITVALIALLLVLKNLWDWVRYDLERYDADAMLISHPLESVSAIASKALAAAAFPHTARSSPQPLMRRRATAVAQRQGYRPARA